MQLKPTTEDIALKLLKGIDISKAAGVDNLPGTFLKDGVVILAKPVTEICNLSIKLFSWSVKTSKTEGHV